MNGIQLYGKSRREVVSFLKEVPPPFTLVCCRHPISFDLLQHPEYSESEEEPEPVQRREVEQQVEQVMEVGMGEVEQMEGKVEEVVRKVESEVEDKVGVEVEVKQGREVEQEVEEKVGEVREVVE